MNDRVIPLVATFLCILTVISTLLVLLPGFVQSLPQDLWMVTANITAFHRTILPTLDMDSATTKAMMWGDYVSVGLWNACMRHDNKNTRDLVCTQPSMSYSFDPIAILNIANGTSEVNAKLPEEIISIVDGHGRHKMLFKISTLVSLGLTVVCMVLGGISALSGGKNRHPASKRRLLGFTALLSLLSTVMLLASAGIGTRAYRSLLVAINDEFEGEMLLTLGKVAMAMFWISVLLSMMGTLSFMYSWIRERRYKHLQEGGAGNMWSKGGVEMHAEDDPSMEVRDDKPLLQRDTAYHSPKHT